MKNNRLISGLKNLGSSVRFQMTKASNTIDNRRLDNYCNIINRIFNDYNKKERTHMIKLARRHSQTSQTRITHQRSVANIAKIIAKELKLNVNLAEVIAANHDVGHTFYGHDGGWWLSDIEQDLRNWILLS